MPGQNDYQLGSSFSFPRGMTQEDVLVHEIGSENPVDSVPVGVAISDVTHNDDGEGVVRVAIGDVAARLSGSSIIGTGVWNRGGFYTTNPFDTEHEQDPPIRLNGLGFLHFSAGTPVSIGRRYRIGKTATALTLF